MSMRTRTTRSLRSGLVVVGILALVASACTSTSSQRASHPVNRRAVPISILREKLGGEEGERDGESWAAQDYENRAWPRDSIAFKQATNAQKAFKSIPAAHAGVANGALSSPSSWTELGPFTPVVPGPVNYTGRETTNSGRVTAMAIAPTCVPGNCRLWVAAAGGGVWRTDDALAVPASWTPIDTGLTSNATGDLVLDPTDPRGRTLYLGTGEPNGSGDSEAGVGLFKTTDGGNRWSLVSGSVPYTKDRGIEGIAIDPTNPNHLYVGTAVARHGSSSVNGGRRTPPNAPTLGLYESMDGGASWTLVLTKTANPNPPAGGSDWFQGSVRDVQLDPNDPTTVYAAVVGYGLFRRTGAGPFEQVFQTYNPSDTYGGTQEFDLVDVGSTTRIYLGDSSEDLGYSVLWRVDDAHVPASTLLGTGNNSGWTLLSSPTNGTPGFGSWGFCAEQCGYDMEVTSPPGSPDEVYLGGQMLYDELWGPAPPRSNGRAVIRSTDAGQSWTDMTNDAQSPPIGMHPDQQAMAFDPNYASTHIGFFGSDGGVVRTSGAFADTSGLCAGRGLTGADLADCLQWLSYVPTEIVSLNDGLRTMQFQSLSVNPANPTGDLLGGTQDNGTWAFTAGGSPTWVESVGGDGGQSGTDVGNASIRLHTYYSNYADVNFRGTDPYGWNWISDPLIKSGEAASFYVPFIADPVTSGTVFIGQQRIWRTTDNGGSQAYLEQYCNELTGTFLTSKPCGDWVALGTKPGGDLTGTGFGSDRVGQYVVAVERAPSDAGTLWAATRTGRVFVSQNANNASANKVTYRRIDTPSTPGRFVSGIAIDPTNPNHAFVSYSGYEAYTPGQNGHVFEVTFNPVTGTATWKDLSANLGDQPILDVAFDNLRGDLYVSSDFGVLLRRASGGTGWTQAAPGLPMVATYGLTIVPGARVLYAATHGRGAWKLALP
jgi:hypothetical protein